MKYSLREYQKDAVRAMIDDMATRNKSIVSLPTGAGKSLVIAKFIDFVSSHHVLILQPSREILAQNRDKLLTYVEKENVGVYSASFNSKEIRKYTFATIQSVYKKPELFREFSIVIIDEAHLYKQGGMFDKLIKNIGEAKIFGLTATPFKLVQKKKYDFRSRTMTVMGVLQMMTQIGFDDIIYTISTKDLTERGFLSPIEYKTHKTIEANFSLNSDKKIVADFDLVLSLSGMDNVITVLNELPNYKSTIVFCPSVSTAMRLNSLTTGISSAFVSGETSKKEREEILTKFKSGAIRVVFNCEVLTTGFDHPALDCIVLARPTKSLNLFNQMIGRGTRLAEGKEKCTVFDITGTVKFLGKLENITVCQRNKDKTSADPLGERLWDVWTEKGYMRDAIMTYHKGRF